MVTEPMDVDHSCEKEEMQVDELSEEESENDNENDEYWQLRKMLLKLSTKGNWMMSYEIWDYLKMELNI